MRDSSIQTESGAWRYLLKKILTQKGLTKSPAFPKGTGLCREVDAMQDTSQVPFMLCEKMLQRIDSHMHALNEDKSLRDLCAYFATPGKVEPRIIALQWFILEAREEEQAAEEAAIRSAIERAAAEDDQYVPRQNAVVEGATVEEWEAGSGGNGFDDLNDPNAKPW